jgi:hypothetical protein
MTYDEVAVRLVLRHQLEQRARPIDVESSQLINSCGFSGRNHNADECPVSCSTAGSTWNQHRGEFQLVPRSIYRMPQRNCCCPAWHRPPAGQQRDRSAIQERRRQRCLLLRGSGLRRSAHPTVAWPSLDDVATSEESSRYAPSKPRSTGQAGRPESRRCQPQSTLKSFTAQTPGATLLTPEFTRIPPPPQTAT